MLHILSLPDTGKQNFAKAAMKASARVLEVTREVVLDLLTCWSPRQDEEFGAGKGSPWSAEDVVGGDDENNEEREGSDENARGVRMLTSIKHLFFFVADPAPFLAAEEVWTSLLGDGTIEVRLHWW